MKKLMYYFLALILGNILFLKFYFNQDIFKVLAFTGILAIAYSFPKFAVSLFQLFTGKNITDSETSPLDGAVINRMNWKSVFFSAIILVILAICHFYGYRGYFKYKDEDLSDKGIYTPAIVTDKKTESRGNNLSGHYIYYTYRYNGQVYRHNCLNDTIEVGDTIVVKFSPNNPDYHLIMDKTF